MRTAEHSPFFRFIGALSLFAALAQAAVADAPAQWDGSAGVALMDFSYKEFGDDGTLLDREDGVLPGIAARFTRRHDAWALAGGISGHFGVVGYDGQTNTGIPITTRSGAGIFDMYLRAELQPPFIRSSDSFYFGLGYSRWTRDIRPTTTASGTPVRGLYEVYEWWRVLLGAYVTVADSAEARWSVDAQAFRTWNPTVAVDFGGLFDNATLRLGEAWGGRLALQWFRRLNGGAGITIEPYIEAWEHGRSATRPLTQNGTVVGTLSEPRSETRNAGIVVSLHARF